MCGFSHFAPSKNDFRKTSLELGSEQRMDYLGTSGLGSSILNTFWRFINYLKAS